MFVLLQAAPTNPIQTLFENLINTGTGAGGSIVGFGFLAAGVLLALSPLSEHGSMKGRAMIAACVIGGVVILGARVWATWVRGITPGGGAPGAGF
jgi:hypothetical protein